MDLVLFLKKTLQAFPVKLRVPLPSKNPCFSRSFSSSSKFPSDVGEVPPARLTSRELLLCSTFHENTAGVKNAAT